MTSVVSHRSWSSTFCQHHFNLCPEHVPQCMVCNVLELWLFFCPLTLSRGNKTPVILHGLTPDLSLVKGRTPTGEELMLQRFRRSGGNCMQNIPRVGSRGRKSRLAGFPESASSPSDRERPARLSASVHRLAISDRRRQEIIIVYTGHK